MTWQRAHEALQVLALILIAIQARRAPTLRPLVATLAAGLLCDAVQLLMSATLAQRFPGTHRIAFDRVALHVSQSAFIAWPFVAAEYALATLPPRRSPLRWLPVPLALAATLSAVIAYPHHNPDAPSPVYIVAACVGAALSCCAVVSWARYATSTRASYSFALVLSCGEVAFAGAYVAGAATSWDLAAPSRFATWAALIVVCLTTWTLAPASPRTSFPPSS